MIVRSMYLYKPNYREFTFQFDAKNEVDEEEEEFEIFISPFLNDDIWQHHILPYALL